MSTVNKLNYLIQTKEQIKQAIIDKGGTVEDSDTFRSYADAIAGIPSGGASLNDIEMYVADFTNPLKITVTHGAINGIAVCYIRD